MSVKYDPMGNRVFKSSTVDSVTTGRKYIVDIIGDLPVILVELNTSVGSVPSVAKTYIYANSQILAQYDGDWRTPLDCKHFYLHDRLGSVRQVIDCQANVVSMYTYSPFGETIEQDSIFDNAFRFTGQWYDNEISQYYLRARMYDPSLSRFTSRDSVLGDFQEPLTLHKYLYCGNNSLNLIDSTGLWAIYVAGTAQGAFGPLGGVFQSGFVFDDEGNFSSITTIGWNYGTPSASFGTSIGYSWNADDIYQLGGMGYAGGGSLGLTKGFSGPSFGLDAFKGDNGVMGIQGTLGVGWAPPVAYGHSIEAHAARTYTFIGDNIPGRVPLGDFAEGIGINWKLQLRIMQQKMRNRLGNLEQRLRNAQNKILEIENIYEEQIYNVRTQGEAYQWYYTYGLISQLPRD